MMRDAKAGRTFATPPTIPHGEIRGFEMTPEPIRIEQRTGQAVSRKPFAYRAKKSFIRRQTGCQRFVGKEVVSHQFRKSGGGEQTGRHASREGLTATGYDRQTRPQRVAGGRVRIVR